MTLRAGALPGLMNQTTAQVFDGSLTFNGTNQYLSKSFGSGNRKTWTWSAWVKRHQYGATNYGLFSYYPGSGNGGFLRFSDDDSGDTFRFLDTGNSLSIVSKEKFRDLGWYHIVIAADTTQVKDSDRIKRYVNGVRQYTNASNTWPSLNDDLDINQSGNHYLGRVQASAYGPVAMSNVNFIDGLALGPGFFGFIDPLTETWRPKKLRQGDPTVNDGRVFSSTGTFSNWDDDGSYPKTELFDGTLYTGGTPNGASSDSGSEATFDFGDSQITGFQNLQVNIFLSSNQATATNVVSVNGVDITQECHIMGNDTWITVDLGSKFTSLKSFRIANNNIYVGGFIIDGVIVKDSTTTTVDFGTNGFYLPMDNQDDFEKDKSGKGNDWTKNNFSGTFIDPDVRKDSPSGAVSGGRAQTGITTTSSAPANYCTWNPLNRASSITTSDGNLKAQLSSSGHVMITGTMSMPKGSGKYYWEIVTAGWNTSNQGPMIGIVGDAHDIADQAGGSPSLLYRAAGEWYVDGSETSTGHTTFTTGDVIGVALDLDRNIITWYKNNVQLFQYTSVSSSVNAWIPAWKDSDSGGNASANWGQKPFKYAPPQGFLPLNSATILPDTVITRPDQYVGVTTWRGDDQASHVINNLNFDGVPDLVWIKRRDGNDSVHQLYDTLRGATKPLSSAATSTEDTQTSGLIDFVKNGFELGASSVVNGLDGDNSNVPFNYLAWCWKAGGNNGTFNVDDVGYASASDVNMSVGALNSAAYNTSNRWSDDYAGATLSSGYEITKAFDGTRTTTARVEATQTAMSVALTNITVSDKIEVCGELGYITPFVEVTVDGTTHQIGGDPDTLISGVAGTTSRVITGVSGALTNVKVGRVSSGRTYLSQIIVDGKILVDDNITVPNAPSIAPDKVSVGTRQGFSIIKYSGDSQGAAGRIPHGLTQKPDFLIFKSLDTSDNWAIYHSSLGQKYFEFTDQGNGGNAQNRWSDIPNDKLIYLGSDTNINTKNHIMYVWHNVEGLQKFGKYDGNNDSDAKDGPFIELGFKPALVAIKRVGIGNWIVYDNKRDPFNPLNGRLYWNDNSANVDNSGYDIDFLSSGFKITGGNNDNFNASSEYCYAAWAEAPGSFLYGGQSNAR
jgi:hypothetical protein